jgi:Flp pilus assembly protein TadD
MSNDPRYLCPACEQSLHLAATQCSHCNTDLSAVAALREWPDACYNEALSACRRSLWVEAVNRLGTCVTVRPGDARAWVLLGKVFAQQSMNEAARLCFTMGAAEPRARAAAEACGGSTVTIDDLEALGGPEG